MKKLRILVLMLVTILSISGCCSIDTSNSVSGSSNTNNPVMDISKTRIFVDSETNVMYTWYKNGYGAGMSVMLNADGSAKTYKQ